MKILSFMQQFPLKQLNNHLKKSIPKDLELHN